MWEVLNTMMVQMPNQISGLRNIEEKMLTELFEIYNRHLSSNIQKNKYYEGKVTLNDVNLGIALPNGLGKVGIGCAWGAKTVDVLAARSMFDGYVDEYGSDLDLLNNIVKENNLLAEYGKACRDE